jgi:hypothetical protein
MDGIVSRCRIPAPNRVILTPERCSQCGAPIPSSKMSLREIAVSIVCGCLLLSILILAGLMAEHWMEDAGRRLVDRIVWRDPLKTGIYNLNSI